MSDQDETIGLRLTVAHHGDNEFYELGDITHEASPASIWASLVADPDTECCSAADSGHDLCWLVDQLVPGGTGDSREITAERAEALLDTDPWTALEAARQDLAAVYAREAARRGA